MKLRFIKTYFLCTLFILCHAGRQYSYAQFPDFHPVSLNETNGLSSNQASCFFQDHNGYIWIGTVNGLNRYDGYSFDVYKKIPHDTTSILSNGISCIVEDQNNCLWIGHNTEGISCFNPATGKFVSYKHDDNNPASLPAGGVGVLYVDRKNNLWVTIGLHALSLFDRKTNSFIHFPQLPGIHPGYPVETQKKYNSIYGIWEDENGLLWLTTHNGLYTFDVQKKLFTRIENKPIVPNHWRDDLYGALTPGKDNSLWLGAWGGGLTNYNRKSGKWKNFKYELKDPTSVTHNIIFAVQFKSPQELWIATSDRGLGVFNIKDEKFYFNAQEQEIKNSPSIYTRIYIDRGGNAWFAHDKGISLMYSDANLFSYTEFPVSKSANGKFYGVDCFYKDTVNHLLFVGTSFADGLHVIDERTGAHQRLSFQVNPFEESPLVVSFIMKARNGVIWISTRDFIYQYDIEKKKLVNIPQPPADTSYNRAPYFYRMMEDHNGMLWITTLRRGVYKLDPGTFTYSHFNHSDSDPHSICSYYINAAAEDRQNNIWFASAVKGISRYLSSTGTFENYLHNDHDTSSPSNDIITGLASDQKRNVWIASYGGLSRIEYNSGKIKFSNINSLNGLSAENLGDIISDANGNIWFTSSAGLGLLNVSENRVRYYTSKDGLKNEYYSLSLFKSDDGEIFMGAYGGYFHFYPSSIKRKRSAPAIAIKSFKIFDKEKLLQADQPIKLSYSDNFFSFDFTSVNFSDPEKSRYAYMLENFDNDWIYCGSRRYASYTNLNGGDYLFKVKSQNADGIWSKELVVPMHIEPPYWKKAWFILLVSALVSLLIYGMYLFRIKQIRKAERIKTELNKKIAEVEMRALRAQMNPHFIFNCLNSINRYIVKSDTKTASLYLTKFAKLIRLILDNSQSKNVILSNELEALQLYIEMESIRFENKFNYEVIVDAEVNAESIEIPPLIIQPYVENAIWHGLLNKETAGKLSVQVSRRNGLLQIVVEDDGVGRARAKELKSKNETIRKSLGLKLTEERLAMLNEHAAEKSSLEIVDLKNEKGTGCGTKIIIKIPVSEN